MRMVCLDLEGVLVPEIWINVAEKSGIKELRLTTRDVPDYDELMQYRLKLLKKHNLRLADIQGVIASMAPIPGAFELLQWLREQTQVIILSDTFTQFAQPLMRQLSWPTLFCNTLIVDDENMIVGYRLRQVNGKKKAVAALQEIGYRVFAAGDSYNDLAMIRQADRGALIMAPAQICEQESDLPHAENYDQFRLILKGFLA